MKKLFELKINNNNIEVFGRFYNVEIVINQQEKLNFKTDFNVSFITSHNKEKVIEKIIQYLFHLV